MKPEHYPTSPAHLWQHFYQFTQTPRPSKQEARIRQYVIDQAEQQGCPWKSDDTDNLVVYVPATAGMENQPTVIIQNHLDMVTVKTDDKDHNFSADPLQLQVEGGWLQADRTTLGADNGLGCAAALALMTDPEVAHPPLELLFTVDEETGLGGALNLDASLLSGKQMLNLDTEDWGELFIGCAGGRGWQMTRAISYEKATVATEGFRLTLNGLAGGHSGIQIHQQLGNAIKLLGQWLQAAIDLGVRLSSFEAGVAHNVIPRQGQITFTCPVDTAPELESVNRQLLDRWQSYLPTADQQLQLTVEKNEVDQVLAPAVQQQLLQLLSCFPHGAQNYNLEQPADLVDLSINLAVCRVSEGQLMLESSARFFNEDEAQPLFDTVLHLADLFQLEVEEILNYPGWKPDFDSPLLALGRELYASLYDAQPEVKAIHAGLECGILKSKMGEVDILSFGPTIRGAHSPSERLEIATVEPFWQLFLVLLQRMGSAG